MLYNLLRLVSFGTANFHRIQGPTRTVPPPTAHRIIINDSEEISLNSRFAILWKYFSTIGYPERRCLFFFKLGNLIPFYLKGILGSALKVDIWLKYLQKGSCRLQVLQDTHQIRFRGSLTKYIHGDPLESWRQCGKKLILK